MPEDTKRLPVGMPWWIGIVATVLMSAALTWDATESVVWTIVAACSALGVGTGGVVVYRRRGGRANPTASSLSVFLSLGAVLGLLACLSLAGCGQRQAIANATAVASVTTSRGAVAWFGAEWQEAEDAAAEAHGSVADVCEAVSEAHRVAQRVECAAVALADLAIAGQALIDASADEESWTAYLAAIPPLIVAVRVAFEAADYQPPDGVTQALAVLAGLLSLVAPGDSPPLTCTVTDGPAECLELADPDAGAERP